MLHTTAQLIIREVRDWWTYTGDGDTKTYQEVCKSKPYENVEIVKAECIGHVQKCVGSRLRSLKEKYKNQVLSDGKKMFGKRWLTKKTHKYIAKLLWHGHKTEYWKFVWNEKECSCGIVSLFWRYWYHKPRFCPRFSESWCKYQRDQLTGESTYKERITIRSAIVKVLKPTFSHADLGNDELLKKCLHGETQNPNELFHNMIWKRCSKRVFVARTVLKTAVASAVIAFNDGEQGLKSLKSWALKKVNIQ